MHCPYAVSGSEPQPGERPVHRGTGLSTLTHEDEQHGSSIIQGLNKLADEVNDKHIRQRVLMHCAWIMLDGTRLKKCLIQSKSLKRDQRRDIPMGRLV